MFLIINSLINCNFYTLTKTKGRAIYRIVLKFRYECMTMQCMVAIYLFVFRRKIKTEKTDHSD